MEPEGGRGGMTRALLGQIRWNPETWNWDKRKGALLTKVGN
jgi:hypothetical protein